RHGFVSEDRARTLWPLRRPPSDRAVPEVRADRARGPPGAVSFRVPHRSERPRGRRVSHGGLPLPPMALRAGPRPPHARPPLGLGLLHPQRARISRRTSPPPARRADPDRCRSRPPPLEAWLAPNPTVCRARRGRPGGPPPVRPGLRPEVFRRSRRL